MMFATATARLRGATVAVAILAGCTSSVRPEPAQQVNGGPDDAGQRENDTLQKLFDLASGKSFYLVVDPFDRQMTLGYRGTPLRRYPILDVRMGVSRIAFVGSRAKPAWAGTVWSDGRLDPPRSSDRMEIKAAESSSADEPPPPPEAIPVPASYSLHYAPNLVVEVRGAGRTEGTRWKRWAAAWRAHARDARAALSSSDRQLIRLRIDLTPDDAEALYRSLPPDTRLLITSASSGQIGATTPARPSAN